MLKKSIIDFLDEDIRKDLLRFSTAGSVDDGKSTLIGRLLHDSKAIYEDTLTSLKNAAYKTTDETEIDFAHLTDGLKAEREQGITIDVAYRYFTTPRRKFIIADTPGHEQYTRNMATGASTANLAIILIDARNGVVIQSKRHAFISSLLGIPHMVVAVNKMDLVGYSQDVFSRIRGEFAEFAAKLGIHDVHFIPISALKGDNVVDKSANMPWHQGAPLLEYLENVYIASDRNLIDLRFPVQYVLRPDLNFRGFCGQIASGVVRRGDDIKVLPSGKTSRVKSIVNFSGELEYAFAPQSVTIVLEDEVDVSRGDMLVHPHNLPHIYRHFEAMVVWMNEARLQPDREYLIKHTSHMVKVRADEILYRINVNTLHREKTSELGLNEIGRVIFSAKKPIYHDPYAKNRSTGSFVIIDVISNATVGAGMILDREPAESIPKKIVHGTAAEKPARRTGLVSPDEREAKYGQKPATVWLTGLVSSGKKEIADHLEKMLFDAGKIAVVLDGSKVRSGLSSELDFSSSDTAEHLRRVAELCKLLNDSGIIALCAFVSPSADIRRQVAEIVGKERFIEVFVDADAAWCASRDRTGLYKRAELGEINDLAGVTSPYERPGTLALSVKPAVEGSSRCAEKILTVLKDGSFIR